jgi:hypothetical protein
LSLVRYQPARRNLAATHRTGLERQLAAAEEQARQTHNPVLLGHRPVTVIDLDGIPDQTTRRLFKRSGSKSATNPQAASRGAASP